MNTLEQSNARFVEVSLKAAARNEDWNDKNIAALIEYVRNRTLDEVLKQLKERACYFEVGKGNNTEVLCVLWGRIESVLSALREGNK